MDELTVSYACPQCGKTYQMQFVAVAIFAYTSGREEPILLLRQCKRCHQLYREGARHECQE
jgi:hypothetical protein